jgi:3-hydroxyisobutyrate dehydrogenase
MTQIGFIGLGNMGLPMARNLIKAGHAVTGYDIDHQRSDRLAMVGGVAATALDMACMGAEVVITMLPAGKEVRDAYLMRGGVLASAQQGALLIDASTVDIETARVVAAAAQVNELAMVDAPVSGGVAGAEAGTLMFMVGGNDRSFARARPILEAMGKAIVHAGGSGHGQAVKICNNMILGASMIAVSEAFLLAEGLGIDPQKLFDIASKASGQCWAMTNCCPVPGPVPGSAANRDFAAGFSAAMMLKDLKLAQDAAKTAGTKVPIGAAAAALYGLYVDDGGAPQDFSGIIGFLRGPKDTPEAAKEEKAPAVANN